MTSIGFITPFQNTKKRELTRETMVSVILDIRQWFWWGTNEVRPCDCLLKVSWQRSLEWRRWTSRESVETEAGRVFRKYDQIGESCRERELWRDENPPRVFGWMLFSIHLGGNYVKNFPSFSPHSSSHPLFFFLSLCFSALQRI